jgi:hypothetical protein
MCPHMGHRYFFMIPLSSFKRSRLDGDNTELRRYIRAAFIRRRSFLMEFSVQEDVAGPNGECSTGGKNVGNGSVHRPEGSDSEIGW